MMNVNVKFGSYNVVKNETIHGVSIYNGNRKVVDAANINWWNKDEIENWMYSHESLIREKDKDEKDILIESLKKTISDNESKHAEYVNDMRNHYQNIVKDLQKSIGVMKENGIEIDSSNVVSVLQKANDCLRGSITDAKERGFVCSRMMQVINRINERSL